MAVFAVAQTDREKIADAVRFMRELPQAECPTKHYFAPGIYIREIFMPADTYVIGKIHRTEHFNTLLTGKCGLFEADGTQTILKAPLTFVSQPGVQKALYIYEDCLWQTIHVTKERDMEALEAEIIEPDESYPKVNRDKERAGINQAAHTEKLLEHKP